MLLGREVFAADSGFVVTQLLELYSLTEASLLAATNSSSSNSSSNSSSSSSMIEGEETEAIREYLAEAISRLCRVMQADFVPFLPKLLPHIFSVLSIQPKTLSTEEIQQAEEDAEFDVRTPQREPRV